VRPAAEADPGVGVECCWRCPAFRPEPCVRWNGTFAHQLGDRPTFERLDRVIAAYDRARADDSIAFPLEILSR